MSVVLLVLALDEIDGMKKIMPKVKTEYVDRVIIVDGGSTDGTIEESKKRGFEEIEQKANACKISLRSGCFCNPGIDEINNDLTPEELSDFFTSNLQGGYREIINALQKMRGATRISVGLATTKADLDYFINFVKKLSN